MRAGALHFQCSGLPGPSPHPCTGQKRARRAGLKAACLPDSLSPGGLLLAHSPTSSPPTQTSRSSEQGALSGPSPSRRTWCHASRTRDDDKGGGRRQGMTAACAQRSIHARETSSPNARRYFAHLPGCHLWTLQDVSSWRHAEKHRISTLLSRELVASHPG